MWLKFHIAPHARAGFLALAMLVPASPVLFRGRNAIERMFCRLKDFRRVATRYDRIATNYLAAVCLAATVSYWLSVRTLALQLRSAPDVGFSGCGLVSAAPERPGNDVSGLDAALGEPHRHAPDLLHRPADQGVA